MMGTVLGQKDRGLAPPAAVGVLVQLVESVREPWAAEQRAASILSRSKKVIRSRHLWVVGRKSAGGTKPNGP